MGYPVLSGTNLKHFYIEVLTRMEQSKTIHSSPTQAKKIPPKVTPKVTPK